MRIGTALLLAFTCACANAQPHGDACQALIPRSLANALFRTFPGYRTPLEYDNTPEDVRRRQPNGGTGCVGVATADLTGEGKKDYVIALTAVKGSAGIAVVALPVQGGWRFRKVASGTENARFRMYVDVVEPGQYGPAAGAAAQPGERQSIRCANWGARAGSVDGGAYVHCYDRGQWSQVRVPD